MDLQQDIIDYHQSFSEEEHEICVFLAEIISNELSEADSKIWRAHPVWFIEGNPIVGYSKQKAGIRLMFWSGADFEEQQLKVKGKKFKDASIFYNQLQEINEEDLSRWLMKSRDIQWDYKNLVKRKGQLLRLK